MNSQDNSFDDLCRLLSPCTGSVMLRHLKQRIAGERLHWESIIGIANHHLVTPALWVRLQQKNLDPVIDPDVRHYLQQLYALNLNRNRELKRQLLEAIALMNQHGIHPLVIKGGSQLIQPIQGDIGARIMTDLDVWVPADQLSIAVDALTANGYSDGGKSLEHYHHWEPLFRDGEYGAIELHREVLPDAIVSALNAADICTRAQEHALQGTRFRTPDPTHAILLGILHSQVKDHLYDQYSISVKALNDMVAMAAHSRGRGGVDWREIESRMAFCGMTPILRTFLWSAHRLFDYPWPVDSRPTLGTVIRHLFCMAAIRWPAVDRLAIEIERCDRSVHRRFGGYRGLWRYTAGRAVPF